MGPLQLGYCKHHVHWREAKMLINSIPDLWTFA